ncbi:MAG: hypothetical protein R3F61_32340 [Myxococcota bacterium]
MKLCPECGTEYEDHVQTCLADGAELIASAVTTTGPGAVMAPTPVAPPARSGGGGALVLLLLPIGFGLLLLLGGVGFVAMGGFGNTTPTPQPVVEPVPIPVPLPAPPPEPIEPPPVDVAFVTIPEGAELFENDTLVCAAPCTVKHPSYAPLPRTFIVKADGYIEQTFEMKEAKGPYLIELNRKRVAAPAPVRPAPAPVPSPGPQVPRPSIGRDRGEDGG